MGFFMDPSMYNFQTDENKGTRPERRSQRPFFAVKEMKRDIENSKFFMPLPIILFKPIYFSHVDYFGNFRRLNHT